MIDLLNRKELNEWMKKRREAGHNDFTAMKGPTPAGMTYSDGEAIEGVNMVNKAWVCNATREIFDLIYGEK